MPVIKARTRGKHFVRHITRLDRENQETLHAYATFLNEPPDYVMNQVIDTLLARDKEFQTWREQHPGPHAPQAMARKARARRHNTTSTGVVSARPAGVAAPPARVG
jgi:hypothetical protein